MVDYMKELYVLWKPVFPYLAMHIEELYGRKGGTILDVGPFVGVSRTLVERTIGNAFLIATFPRGMGRFLKQEIVHDTGDIPYVFFETDPSLDCMRDHSVDLVIFRGAFFFPEVFVPDIQALHRVLKPDGVGIVGGGFGKYTPPSLIQEIGERSRDLNKLIGKVNISRISIEATIISHNMERFCEIISDGGLWVIIRKQKS